MWNKIYLVSATQQDYNSILSTDFINCAANISIVFNFCSKSNIKGDNDVECEITPGPAVRIDNNLLRSDSNIIFYYWKYYRSESVIYTF